MTGEYRVRVLGIEDASRVADLSAQLGYSAGEDEIRDRLSRIVAEPCHKALGAEGPNGLVGFVHFFERPSKRALISLFSRL